MRKLLCVLKLFFLNWFITVTMYGIGSLIIKFDPRGYRDLVAQLSSISLSPMIVDMLIYLFISFSIVVLISYSLNKFFFKVSTKLFIISQALFILSIPCTALMATI